MTIRFEHIVIALFFLFAAWALWTLASGILGVTLGQLLLFSVAVYLGFLLGRGR
jgi:hypothetical protein